MDLNVFRDLSSNNFSGPIPALIGDLEHLLTLYVCREVQFFFEFNCIQELANLLSDVYTRNLSRNHLHGRLPAEFGNLRSIQIM